MSPYEGEGGDGGKLRVALPRTRESLERLPPSVSLIITACVPAKITPFIHPRHHPSLSLSLSLSHPASRQNSTTRIARRARVFIRHCVLAKLADVLCAVARSEVAIHNNARDTAHPSLKGSEDTRSY